VDATELAFAGATRQAALLREGELTPRDLVEVYLERIERIDPELGAFRVVLADEARAAADEAAERLRAGDESPMLGIPVAIKDEVYVKGQMNTFGTGAGAGPAAEDSAVVARLRAAGAIPIGITKVPELTMWAFTETKTWGITRNPWDLERTPGGSSGGSAAAVAAGLAPVALGTDGLGSVRIPAACCGLVGIKTQRGRVSFAPQENHWHGLSVIGPIVCRGRRLAGRSVEDRVLHAHPGTPRRHRALPGRARADGRASALARARGRRAGSAGA